MIQLGLVLYQQKWLLGQIERGLPPAIPKDDEDEVETEPIGLRGVVEVIHASFPAQSEIGGGAFVMTTVQLGRLPGAEEVFYIEYSDVAPGWKIIDVNETDTEGLDEIVVAYLRLMKLLAEGSRRVRLTS